MSNTVHDATMKRKKLKKYLDQKWKPGEKALKAYLDKENPEALHRFRVQVKKVRAFIELAEHIKHPLKLKRHFKPVKKIFHQAGIIRDAQLQLKLGVMHHADKTFKEKQRKTIKVTNSKLKAKKSVYQKRIKKSRKLLKHHLDGISSREVTTFYRQQLGRIADHLNPIQSVDLLHPCRKLIKILLYDYKLAGKVLSFSIDTDYLKRLETAIGDWHDNQTASRQFPELKLKK